jgi:hypothetical protein
MQFKSSRSTSTSLSSERLRGGMNREFRIGAEGRKDGKMALYVFALVENWDWGQEDGQAETTWGEDQESIIC